MRALLALVLPLVAYAYSVAEAKASTTFLKRSEDVLSIVAPFIDPQFKLAAQTTVTLSRSYGAHDTLIENVFKQTANPKVIEARRVVAFTITLQVTSSNRVAGVKDFIATWARTAYGSSPSDILVVAVAQDINGNRGTYNVTIAAPRESDWDKFFLSAPDWALRLVGNNLPACATSINSKSSVDGCNALCTAFNGRPGNQVTSDPACPANVLSKSIGTRYVIDFFSAFSTPNGLTASRLSSTAQLMPSTVLQYQLPVAFAEPSSINRIPTLAGTLGASALLLAVVGYSKYTSDKGGKDG